MQIQGWVILNFYTALILALLLVFIVKSVHSEAVDRFIQLDVMTLVLLISETVGHIGEIYSDKLLMLTKIGYYIIYILDPADYLFAILYINCWMNQDKDDRVKKVFINAFKLFVIVNFVLVTVSTLFNLKWFYYFDGDSYERGIFFYPRAVMLMVFCLLLSVYSIIYRKEFFPEYRMAIFSLPTLAALGAFLQAVFSDLNITYASIAIGLLLVYFNIQSKDLDIDYLTGTFNRRGLDIRLEESIRSANLNHRCFAAVMLDVDKFKNINDTYGHDEGDYALKKVADILIMVFNSKSVIGRFGGDEFCVITEIRDQTTLDEKIDLVEDELDKWNYKRERPYNLEVSMGQKIYDFKDPMSAKEFQMAIDELMYIQKRKHHLADARRRGKNEAG